MLRRRLMLAICSLLFLAHLRGQSQASQDAATWAEAKLAQMTLSEKVGQLFMVAAYSNKTAAHQAEIEKLVKNYHIGGLIFMQDDPLEQARLTNRYQQVARTPLWIAMDAEWGLAMRLQNTFAFPWALTLGATRDSALAFAYGRQMALHCRRLGVHVNFAPVVDLNSNPDNPIINARSLGEDPKAVAPLADAWLAGMQAEQVMGVAKHFPGHGNTAEDSHKTLPTVGGSLAALQQTELAPYRYLIQRHLEAIMSAHLNVPALDPSGKPVSLSPLALRDYLRGTMGFDGLVFTDALNMKGVTANAAPGELEWLALQAGNDVLLFSQNVPLAADYLLQKARRDSVVEQRIERSVRRILEAKYRVGAHRKQHVYPQNLIDDLHSKSARIVRRQVYEQAATLLINREHVLPVQNLREQKIALLKMGKERGAHFGQALNGYHQVDTFEFSPGEEFALLNKLNPYDLVIVAYYTPNANPWQGYQPDAATRSFVKRLALQNKFLLTLFANPYALRSFPEAELAQALLVSYQNHRDAETAAAQVIFGAVGAQGRLPVSISATFPVGSGISTQALGRLGYAYPEEMGFDGAQLHQAIDDIMQEAMSKEATPGGQILVARRGKVVFEKAYGYHTYAAKKPVQLSDIYDLASVTKIAATVPLLMRLVEQGRLDLHKTLGDYLPMTHGTNKENLKILDVLTHQARLRPWIPFYVQTLGEGELKPEIYARRRSFEYPYTVADQLYSNRSIQDTIYGAILASPLRAKKEYKYSDLGYYFLIKIIEQLEGRPLDQLAQEYFYEPLGASTMRFRPLATFAEERIIPTEDDQVFRGQLLRGYVHDQGAAMLGGVAGHAGLFANAHDVAKLMQMYLQGGRYGGHTYFDSITVREFTRCQFCDADNRRGIGFDKPQFEGEPGPTCGCVSPLSFGHSGFTGILAWADPQEEIIYVFLSNRVYPDANNRKLITLDTRTKIQEAIYEALQITYSADTVATALPGGPAGSPR